jgi:hypothetical protein
VAWLDHLVLPWGLRNEGEHNTILPINADPKQVRDNSGSTNCKDVRYFQVAQTPANRLL